MLFRSNVTILILVRSTVFQSAQFRKIPTQIFLFGYQNKCQQFLQI